MENMSDNDTEIIDSTNDTTEEVDKTEEVDETDDQSESEDLEALKEKNKRLFERTKKAEAEAKLLKAERLKAEEKAKAEKPKPTEKQDGLTPMDVMVLTKADVHEDDIEEVINYAKFKGVDVKTALKDKTMQTILRDKTEQRSTAEATNTFTARAYVVGKKLSLAEQTAAIVAEQEAKEASEEGQ